MRKQREKKQNAQKGDKKFEGEGRVGVLHYQRGDQIGQWRYTGQRGPSRKSQCYRQQRSRGAAPRMRAGKNPEFGEGKQ